MDLVTIFSDFDEVLSENCDDPPEAAFYMVGGLMDVNTHRYLCSFIVWSVSDRQWKTSKVTRRIGNLLELGDCTASGKV